MASSGSALEEGTAFTPRFGASGLITAVAADAVTGEVLMVAHMNREALSRTLQSGEAHFWSRSRQAIWRKGETSGNVLRIVEIRADCDQDCLLLRVEIGGDGAACHTGRRSCFYRRVEMPSGQPDDAQLSFILDVLTFLLPD
ncbi:MAG: phosphoribosyl-AMP cyclohydrolase [Rhodomicrobium sp.]|nr:phosphoribosyl-AMP cyclohydrolase [Rhodomicrobium sp.]